MVINVVIAGVPVGDSFPVRIMSIINLSSDSFYKGSIIKGKNDIENKLLALESEKPDFIDVGALSSAPARYYGYKDKKSIDEELNTIKSFLKIYFDLEIGIPVSIDTSRSLIADYCLSKGVEIINDISGLKSDNNMASVIADHDASVIVMACEKIPGDVFTISDIKMALEKTINMALQAGISSKSIVIDPGLGGWVNERNPDHDYQIINNLPDLRILEHPLLVGISRKSFIGSVLHKSPEERLWGSLAATTAAIMNGAHIIRTHDVNPTKDVALITKHLMSLNKKSVY